MDEELRGDVIHMKHRHSMQMLRAIEISKSHREEGRLRQRGECWLSRAASTLFRAHLSWQAARRCLLFVIRSVLVRLVDVTGQSKMWTLSQKSMAGMVRLPGMSEPSGKYRRKRGGEMVRDGAACGWTCRLITPRVDRRWAFRRDAVFYTVAPCGAHKHTHTHCTCKRCLNNSRWSSPSPFSSTNVLWIIFLNLFCPLLQLAMGDKVAWMK